MQRPDDDDEGGSVSGGASVLLPWLEWMFVGDDYARAATRKALMELAVFYVLIAVGFLALYCTWRSNANLKQWKRELAGVVDKQRGRKFEGEEGKMYGMF